jgi:type I restriction enzyme S subunit
MVRVTDIAGNRFDDSDLALISSGLDHEFRRSRLEGGEVLISIQGTIGRVAVCPREYAGANISRTIAVIAPDDRVERRFLYWYLRHLGSTGAYETVGSTRDSLNIETLRRVHVPVPPLSEQQRIAGLLDLAETAAEGRERVIGRMDPLRDSILRELVGDPLANPRGWPTATLKHLGKVSTGRTPPTERDGMFGGDIPFVTPGDLDAYTPVRRTVTADGAAASKTVRVGATFVSCIGYIGKMRKATEISAFNQQLNAIEWGNEVHDDYGIAVLRFYREAMSGAATSTTVPILKKSTFEQIAIPVPDFALQNEFARRIAGTEQLRLSQERSLRDLEQLLNSLQHYAFRGEL